MTPVPHLLIVQSRKNASMPFLHPFLSISFSYVMMLLIVSYENAAKLAGWISDVLQKAGNAQLAHRDILSLKEISVYDYVQAYELPTDQYSLPEGDSESD